MERIGPYQLEARLGEGGMGVVFRARRPDGVEVALKLLRAKGDAERFVREVRTLAQLGASAGFVPLLDAGSSPAGLYLVMPLLPGGDLAQRLRRGPLPLPEVIELGRRLAAALAHAHAVGVVHRDLKPENVLFDDAGRPVVADLGLAKYFLGSESGLSRTGELRGTAGYMPPEQLRDAKRVTPASDVFAWGAVLYEALTGRPAFAGEEPLTRILQTAAAQVAPPRELRPEVPAWLEAMVLTALAPDPTDRYPTGEALHVAFRAASLAPEVVPTGRSGPGAVAAALTLPGVVIVGALAFALRPSSPLATASPAPSASASPERTPGAASSPSQPAPAETPAPSPSPSLAEQTPAPSPTDPLERARAGLLASLQAAARGAPWRVLDLWGDPRGKHGARSSVAVGWLEGDEEVIEVGVDGVVVRWSAATGEERDRFRLGLGAVYRAQILPDATLVVAQDEEVVAFDLRARRRLWAVPTAERAEGLRLDPSRRLLALCARKELRLLELPGLRERWRQPLDGGSWEVELRFLPGREELLANETTCLLTFSLADGARTVVCERLRLKSDQTAGSAKLAVSPDGALAITAVSNEGALRWWDLAARREAGPPLRWDRETNYGATSVAWARDGRALFVGLHDGAVLRARPRAQEPEGRLPVRRPAMVTVLAPGPGERLLTVGVEHPLCAFDGESPRWPEVTNLPMSALAVTPDDQRLVSAGNDVVLWDAAAGRRPRHLVYATRYGPLFLSPSGRRACTPGQRSWTWDLERGGVLATLGDLAAADQVLFLGDDHLILSLGAAVGRRSGRDVGAALWSVDIQGRGDPLVELDGACLALARDPADPMVLRTVTDRTLGRYSIRARRWLARRELPRSRAARSPGGRPLSLSRACLDAQGAAVLVYRSLGDEVVTQRWDLEGEPRELTGGPSHPDHQLAALRWGAAWFEGADSLHAQLVMGRWDRVQPARVDLPLSAGVPFGLVAAPDGERLYLGTSRGLVLTLDLVPR
ncbi:MAG: protein kinase [Planctomycetota bacterium]